MLLLGTAGGGSRLVYRPLFRVLHDRWAAAGVTLGVAIVYVGGSWALSRLMVRLTHGRRRRAGFARTPLRRLVFWRQATLGRPRIAVPWHAVEVLTLRPARGGRHRFTAGRRGRWWFVPVVPIDLDLSMAEAAVLAGRIDGWRVDRR